MSEPTRSTQLAVIGGGPGGYTAAFMAADLEWTIHPHPTLSETVMEVAEVFFGQRKHLYRPKKG